jgi:hypothetical protein
VTVSFSRTLLHVVSSVLVSCGDMFPSSPKIPVLLLEDNVRYSCLKYETVSKSFRTGASTAIRCSCIAMSSEFCRHNLLCCFPVSVYWYFFIDSVRKLLDTPSYMPGFLNVAHRFAIHNLIMNVASSVAEPLPLSMSIK